MEFNMTDKNKVELAFLIITIVLIINEFFI